MNNKILLNERGVSLVEVIASIVLLAIILISLVSFFPQMGLKNNQNEDKQEAVNLASKELAFWKGVLESPNSFSSLLANPSGSFPFIASGDTIKDDPNTKTITIKTPTTKSMTSKYNTEIKIARAEDLKSLPTKANQISVLIYKNNTILVTEIHGYVFY